MSSLYQIEARQTNLQVKRLNISQFVLFDYSKLRVLYLKQRLLVEMVRVLWRMKSKFYTPHCLFVP